MQIFIEGYDRKNWGDVLMAAATTALATDICPHAQIILPRKLPLNATYERLLLERINIHVTPSRTSFDLFHRKRAAYEPSVEATKALTGNAILYCNGYIFGDPWPDQWLTKIGYSFDRIRRRGGKIILMPQSFGPFTNPEKAKLIRTILSQVDYVFTRDKSSHQYLMDLQINHSQIHQSVDYTPILNLFFPAKGVKRDRIVIIPNRKIGDTFGREAQQTYVSALCNAVRVARLDYGLTPVILEHTDGKDNDICREISEKTSSERLFVDPILSKKLISESRFVIASRFHGLINALSQEVPAISLGWSAKYNEAMRRYGQDGFLFDITYNHDLVSMLRDLIRNENEIATILRQARQNIEDNEFSTLKRALGNALAHPGA